MEKAKIKLSQEELELLGNAAIILTKNRIIQKAIQLFASIQVAQNAFMKQEVLLLPVELFTVPPKISKGENYEGLPYIMLDYPRLFTKNDTLAIRTMCWWGKYFSVTLHLSGKWKMNCEDGLVKNFSILKHAGFYYCVNEQQWEHHFEENNYQMLASIKQADWQAEIKGRDFIKLAMKVPLSHWDIAEEELMNGYKILIGVIKG